MILLFASLASLNILILHIASDTAICYASKLCEGQYNSLLTFARLETVILRPRPGNAALL